MARADAGVEPANTSRYTYDGDEQVEARIDQDQKLIGAAVGNFLPPPALRSLVLIGGYGRAEGGFCYRDGKPSPYNDYDYFVVVRGVGKKKLNELTPGLEALAKELEQQVGVEVDFFFLREETLSTAEFSLMFAEMQWGHRVVFGDPDVLETMPPMPMDKLPLAEFTRLMLNRGSLLLINRQTLAVGGPVNDQEREIFVKYLFKAVLAVADAQLASRRRYHPSYPEKLRRLEDISEDAEINALLNQYRIALDARFHPDYQKHMDADLSAWQSQVISLWLAAMHRLEGERIGRPVTDWHVYAQAGVSKGQSVHGMAGCARNLAVTLRDYGLGEIFSNGRWAMRYPRERLISTLPLLLVEDETVCCKEISSALSLSKQGCWAEASSAFLEQWKRYA